MVKEVVCHAKNLAGTQKPRLVDPFWDEALMASSLDRRTISLKDLK